MKTINSIHFETLVAEASEADELGLTKIAENITRQIENVDVRDISEKYSYNTNEFKQDIQDSLWSIVIRTADFHKAKLDSKKAQDIVDYYSAKIVDELRKTANIKNVGAYESLLPGEKREEVTLEIEE